MKKVHMSQVFLHRNKNMSILSGSERKIKLNNEQNQAITVSEKLCMHLHVLS